MNWHDRRKVLLLVGVICAVVFVAGMGAAWLNRDNTICSDGKPPAAQRGGVLLSARGCALLSPAS